jgi:hypothetical protein
MPGYQEILDQNILYIIIEKNRKPIPCLWIEKCVFSNLLYEIYKQLQSENRCTIIKNANQKTDAST